MIQEGNEYGERKVITFMFLCVDTCYGTHVEVSDNLRMSVFSSHHMGTVNQTQDFRLGGKYLASPGMLLIALVGSSGGLEEREEECLQMLSVLTA